MDVRARMGLTAIGVALYAVVSHELTTRAGDTALALAVVLGPLLVSLLVTVSISRVPWQRWLVRLVALAAIVGLASATHGGVPAPWLYFAQHAGVHAALGIWFAGTLRGVPLITQLAGRLHALTPDMVAYTRHCTVAWVGYFAAITAISTVLFAFAPLATWSVFANLLTPVSLVLMFVGEHLLRYRLHPEFERVGLVAAARAFSARPRAPEGNA